ncbi:MAG: ISKra4 family transposase, partial [Planctomycetota bacterium]
MGLNGPVTVRRARFRCVKSGAFEYPLDAVLDLPPHEVTVSVARRALRLTTHMSFETVQEELYYQHEVQLSDSVLDRVMQTAGQVAERDRAQAAEALQALPEGVAREECALAKPSIVRPKRLYVSCDGAMYPTRYRKVENGQKRLVYQEMKCATVFWQEGTSQWHKRVQSSRAEVDEFGLSVWELAVQCGLLQADEVIFISDGGAWCDTIAKRYFHDATRILDWYHLVEHLWTAARVLYADEAEAKRWVSRGKDMLMESSGIGLLRFLQHSRTARAAKASAAEWKAIDDLIGYLEPRRAITDYVEYRAKGFAIGSGIMESTCKQLVGARLKGSGRQWSEAGAVAMAALIAQRINSSWDAFWASRPLHR